MESLDQSQEVLGCQHAPEAWVHTWPEVPILDPVSKGAVLCLL